MSPTAVVTGAAAGIGAATARALADAGYTVACWDLDDAVTGTAERVGGLAVRVDVADADAVTAALAETRQRSGVPTAVFTGAGIMRTAPFLDLTPADWQRTLQVNLTGTFLVLRACAAAMVEAGRSGAMVAGASVAARGPRADSADYAASKAGVISLVRSAALALAPQGIRVNAVCPGVVDTPMTQRNAQGRAERDGRTPQDVLDALVATVPLGRMARADEVAGVVVRLLGDEFGYVTGQALNVCGGLEFD